MAKFVSQVYSEIRGSVNGVTYARNRYGLYARSKSSPVQPRTPAQAQRRAQMTVLSQRWRTLDEAIRAEWRSFADDLRRSDSLGQQYRLSGLQAYLQFNLWRALMGLAPQDNPPATLPAPAPVTITGVTLVAGPPAELNLAFSPTPYSGALAIWATAPFSRGINFVAPSRYRLIAVRRPATFGGTLTSPINILADYVAKFGIPTAELAGKRVAFALTPLSHGTADSAGVAGQRTTFLRDF